MKKLFSLFICLVVFCGIAFGYSSQSTIATGTVTTGAVSTISFGRSVYSIMVLNDSTAESMYVNLEGDLTTATMTTGAFSLNAGEYIIADEFTSNYVKLLGKTGTATYRIFASY